MALLTASDILGPRPPVQGGRPSAGTSATASGPSGVGNAPALTWAAILAGLVAMAVLTRMGAKGL